MTRPTARQMKAMADAAGVPVTDEVAARIANSIGPAFDGLAPIAGTLPFDLEPATFLVVQNEMRTPWHERVVDEVTRQGDIRIGVGPLRIAQCSAQYFYARITPLFVCLLFAVYDSGRVTAPAPAPGDAR